MKNAPDKKLRDVLHVWQVSPTPDSDFKASVWSRIADEEELARVSIWTQLREWLYVQLPRPAYAAAVLAVTAVLSTAAANLNANHASERYRADSARQYLASIDPISMAAQASHSRP